MYRLTTAVFNLGGLGVSHHRYFGLHHRGRWACGRGQLATFTQATPIRTSGRGPWLGYLLECRVVSGRGQFMHSVPHGLIGAF